MKDMKHKRGSFAVEQLDQEIIGYCKDEVQALVRLMNRLREYLCEIGIRITS
jgi:hypothetical protein